MRAKHDAAFQFLEANVEWSEPQYKRLRNYDGLGEVRLQGKVAWRVFGFRRTEDNIREFIVLAVGNHKQQVYRPKNVLKTATRRMKEVQNDPKKAEYCERPESD